MSTRRPSRTSSKEQALGRSSTTKTQAVAKPSAISARSSAGLSRSQAASAKKSSSATVAPPKKKEFELPALSLTYKPKVTESELEKLKKKTIRRNAPPGEDLKHIREILRTIKDQNITVHEFIALIAPSTGDNGALLRSVMNDDLNSFRKLARKVYETITQDNSDVLLNQQLQLSEYYRERKAILHDKMMRYINEIYMMASNFDFDRYAAEKEKYLLELFPIPEELKVEPEEIEMMKRQAAYHRLNWLRSEGERLNEENNSLKKRLNQLKRLHKEEQQKMMQMEQMAEARKEHLEAQEAAKVETLEMLNESLEKSMIAQESKIRTKKDSVLREPPKQPGGGAIKKKKSKGAIKKRRPPWNEEAAKQIEEHTMMQEKSAEMSRTAREKSPFHFSPIKTPPQQSSAAPREISPFHYSPNADLEPHVSLPQQPAAQPQPQRSTRRGSAPPRDTWGGFY